MRAKIRNLSGSENRPLTQTGQNTSLYSSRQETRQRLSQSLEEIAIGLDQTREQVEALRNSL